MFLGIESDRYNIYNHIYNIHTNPKNTIEMMFNGGDEGMKSEIERWRRFLLRMFNGGDGRRTSFFT